jgi:hypothetical protein
MQTGQTIDSLEGRRMVSESTAKPGRRRRVVWTLCLVAVAAGVILWWHQPAPLSTDERALVGTWTLPMGPAPPANAVQQLFELHVNRTLVTYGRSVGSGVTTPRGGGTWHLEAGALVFEHVPAHATWKYLQSLVGEGPPPTGFVDRLKFLRSEGDRFFVEASDGSEAAFERVPE